MCCAACVLLCAPRCRDALFIQLETSVEAEPGQRAKLSSSHVWVMTDRPFLKTVLDNRFSQCLKWANITATCSSVKLGLNLKKKQRVTAVLSIKSVVTGSLPASAKQGINIIMDYTVLSCRGGADSWTAAPGCRADAMTPPRLWGYFSSSWYLPVAPSGSIFWIEYRYNHPA